MTKPAPKVTPSIVVPQPTSSWIGPMSTPNEYSHDPYEVIVAMPRTSTPNLSVGRVRVIP
jgi:hypothetical protein